MVFCFRRKLSSYSCLAIPGCGDAFIVGGGLAEFGYRLPADAALSFLKLKRSCDYNRYGGGESDGHELGEVHDVRRRRF